MQTKEQLFSRLLRFESTPNQIWGKVVRHELVETVGDRSKRGDGSPLTSDFCTEDHVEEECWHHDALNGRTWTFNKGFDGEEKAKGNCHVEIIPNAHVDWSWSKKIDFVTVYGYANFRK